MRYTIVHSTLYAYSHPVQLGTHCVKLCPRNDGAQQLRQFELTVEPPPRQQAALLDPEGNCCHRFWFQSTPVTRLKVVTTTEVETNRTNPFDYLTAPWAIALPFDYPMSLEQRLSPYLAKYTSAILHPKVIEFAYEILHQVNGNAGLFVSQLTQAIYDRCQYIQRLEGAPYPSGITLTHQKGTCRDFAVLWMDACRAVGLAARFVSGYQQGDPDQESNDAQHDLHAWAEVYMPGGGWRGFDPTLGLAVTDGHVAIAAAADSRHAAPIKGQIQSPKGQPKTTLDCHISLKTKYID
ncbi:MAG: transglutaminase family protein [Cyanobacteria bacterium P01_F01_bin.150]